MLITVNQAARIKGCSRQAIHAAIKAKRLPVKKERAIIYKIDPADLEALKINPNMQRKS